MAEPRQAVRGASLEDLGGDRVGLSPVLQRRLRLRVHAARGQGHSARVRGRQGGRGPGLPDDAQQGGGAGRPVRAEPLRGEPLPSRPAPPSGDHAGTAVARLRPGRAERRRGDGGRPHAGHRRRGAAIAAAELPARPVRLEGAEPARDRRGDHHRPGAALARHEASGSVEPALRPVSPVRVGGRPGHRPGRRPGRGGDVLLRDRRRSGLAGGAGVPPAARRPEAVRPRGVGDPSGFGRDVGERSLPTDARRDGGRDPLPQGLQQVRPRPRVERVVRRPDRHEGRGGRSGGAWSGSATRSTW